jgi:hypothetical protein
MLEIGLFDSISGSLSLLAMLRRCLLYDYQVYTFHKKCFFAKNVKCVDLTPNHGNGIKNSTAVG